MWTFRRLGSIVVFLGFLLRVFSSNPTGCGADVGEGSDPVSGPPRVIAVAVDLNGNGLLEADGDPSSWDSEEMFPGSIPFIAGVPVGRAVAPTSIGFFLSEPLSPSFLFEDAEGDGVLDHVRLRNVTDGVDLPFRTFIAQKYLPDERRCQSFLSLVPETTLPPGALIEARLLGGFSVALSFLTGAGPASLEDRWIEDFEDQRKVGESNSADWNVDRSGALSSELSVSRSTRPQISRGESIFLDTGARRPSYSFDATDPRTGLLEVGPGVSNVLLRRDVPEGVKIHVFFEGAPPHLEKRGQPDPSRATGFVSDIEALNGMRFFRYRVVFDLGPDYEATETPAIEQLSVGFHFDT